ncbi:DNA primase [Pseudobacteriovorax antillogorgiicola]|uniref:DNA primase n=1 Tax=Pseudobacteriovorax antillogorgiicola TaxID=1513793 RepID=A0A1Y6BDI9_9BACT|nr:DNA primase [Pseudobacteriovorax antillogorgiicola]TCS58727.1 DNA primase [Pseudobacteriovorax antillogorgiicola]SME95329.1 DNA primase [Pseudobacteriovorax antillogorgiicola]
MSVDVAKRRILDKVPLASLIGESIQLSTRSGRQVGLCPFHQEKSPSFTIFDDHYFCFGCQARGDAIEYVRHTQGLSFIEALKYLAEKYGIEAPELEDSRKAQESRQQATNLYRILKTAQAYFQHHLEHQGSQVRTYLHKRGFSDEAIEKFGFGYAPDQAMGLVSALLKKGFSLKDATTASVATQSQRDLKTYDFFRHRLMIPIKDHHGRLIAYGGRTMGDDPAKYKNSRETPLFDKSHVLYGLDRAKEHIRKNKRAVVVEGYMDALQLWNHGFGETVACLGTSLTPHHMQRLSNLTETVYLIFDGDQAGKNASLRTVSNAIELPKTQFKVVRLAAKDDPDSFVRRQGPDAFEACLGEARDLLDFAIVSKVGDAHDLAIPDLIQADIIPWLKSVRDPVRRSFLINKVSHLTGVDRESIQQIMIARPKGASAQPKPKPVEAPKPKQEAIRAAYTRKLTNIEYDFLGHVYYSQPEQVVLSEIESLLAVELELEPLWVDLCHEFLKCLKKGISPAKQDISSWHTSSELAAINLMKNFHEKESAFQAENRQSLIQRLGKSLRQKQLQETVSILKKRLDDADIQQQTEILSAISKLNGEIRSLER